MVMHDLTQTMGGWKISTEITVNVNTREEEGSVKVSSSTTSAQEVDGQARSSSCTTREDTTRLRASTASFGGGDTAQPAGVRHGYGEPAVEAPGLEIWRRDRFQSAPRGADQWQVDLLNEGW